MTNSSRGRPAIALSRHSPPEPAGVAETKVDSNAAATPQSDARMTESASAEPAEPPSKQPKTSGPVGGPMGAEADDCDSSKEEVITESSPSDVAACHRVVRRHTCCSPVTRRSMRATQARAAPGVNVDQPAPKAASKLSHEAHRSSEECVGSHESHRPNYESSRFVMV